MGSDELKEAIREYDEKLRKQYYKELSEKIIGRYIYCKGINCSDSDILNDIMNSLEKYIG